MTSPPTPARRELFVAAALVLAASAAYAALNWPVFRPGPDAGGDFTQDWLSARDYQTGYPLYGDLGKSLPRHVSTARRNDALRWNAHPPVSVLFFLPLGYLSHEDAYFAWNLLTFPLFVAAVAVVAWQLGARGWRAGAIAAAVTLVAAVPVLGSFPIHQQVSWGQFSAPITFLVVAAWAADRNDRPVLAGAAVGLAAAVKLFPAFLLLYFAATGRWRTVFVTVAIAVALNAVALATFGTDAFRTYVTEVVPGVSAQFGSDWANLSVRAFWLRLFDPALPSRATALADAPIVGRVMEVGARGAITLTVAVLAWRANTGARRDRAFAAGTAAMVLVSPISWAHSILLLVLPIGLLAREARGARRWLLLVCLVVLWLPLEFVTGLVFGREFAAALVNAQPRPLTPAEVLLGTAAVHYAILGVFLLVAALPTDEPRTG